MAIDPQLTISYVCPKSATLKQHVHSEHRDEDKMPWRRELPPSVYQTVFANQSVSFQVRLPAAEDVSSLDNVWQAALAAVPRVTVGAQGTTRDLTPFLMTYTGSVMSKGTRSSTSWLWSTFKPRTNNCDFWRNSCTDG